MVHWLRQEDKIPQYEDLLSKSKAKTICKFCVRCNYLRRKTEVQKMAPLPADLTVPCPAFTNVAVDLAGPFQVFSMLKSRGTRRGTGTMKVWALLAVCLNTRALKIYLVAGYGTEDFLVLGPSWKLTVVCLGGCLVTENLSLCVLQTQWRGPTSIGTLLVTVARVRLCGRSAPVVRSGEMARWRAWSSNSRRA